MSEFLKFLTETRESIFIFFLIVFSVILALQWLLWIFGQGRFSKQKSDNSTSTIAVDQTAGQNLRYIFSEAAVKIINDFRHLLALIIVMIFACALAYAMHRAANFNEMKEAFQVVVATLGGIVGSIMGYYFGESKVMAQKYKDASASESLQPTVQSDEITAVTLPQEISGKA